MERLKTHIRDTFGRVRGWSDWGDGPLGRLIGGVVYILLVLVVIAVLVPVLLIVAAAGLIMFGAGALRRYLFTAKQPNGILDGRRNVRVRPPEGADSE